MHLSVILAIRNEGKYIIGTLKSIIESYVDENVTIGKGTKVWHFSHVQSGSVIGNDCILGQNVNVGNNVIIGDNCKIQNNVSIYEGVE